MSATRKARGFSEESSEFSHPQAAARTGSIPSVRTTLGEGGRLVIPAAMRKAMGINPGDTVILKVNDGEMTALSQTAAIRKIQQRLSALRKPGESVVDEFLAERREEQRRSDERLDRLHAEGLAMKAR